MNAPPVHPDVGDRVMLNERVPGSFKGLTGRIESIDHSDDFGYRRILYRIHLDQPVKSMLDNKMIESLVGTAETFHVIRE